MTDDQPPGTGPDEVERRDYSALVDSLAGTLDLRCGLAEAVDVADYTAMRSSIASLLDLDAGLQSALAAHCGTGQPSELDATTSVADMLSRASGGDSAAWAEIIRRYSNVVIAAVRSFRLQDADALDAVQMTWLRLAEDAHRIQFAERLAGWLATTARRECLHILRQQAKHTPIPTKAAAENVVDPGTRPEQRAVDRDTAQTQWGFVVDAGLPLLSRTVLRALFTDNARPYTEVRAASIPPGGIGPTRARALQHLRRRLGEYESALTARAPETRGSDLPIAADVLGPEVAVLPLPDVAQRLGLPVIRVHQMVRDGQLLGLRRDGVVVVPADFLSGSEVVKGLPSTITVLGDAGYSREEILRWLFTTEASLPNTPIGELRSEVMTTG